MGEEINISGLSPDELENKLATWAYRLSQAEIDLAKADSEHYALKIWEDVVYNKGIPQDGTVAEKEKIASSNPDYHKHLEGLAQTYKNMAEAKAKHARAKVWHETLKSILLKRMQ